MVGFRGGQQIDLLDFNKLNLKIKVVRNKSETVVENLTQMIVKDLQSLLEVLGICNHLVGEETEAVVFKFQIVNLSLDKEITIDTLIRKLAVLKLYGIAPAHLNSLGSVLH